MFFQKSSHNRFLKQAVCSQQILERKFPNIYIETFQVDFPTQVDHEASRDMRSSTSEQHLVGSAHMAQNFVREVKVITNCLINHSNEAGQFSVNHSAELPMERGKMIPTTLSGTEGVTVN